MPEPDDGMTPLGREIAKAMGMSAEQIAWFCQTWKCRECGAAGPVRYVVETGAVTCLVCDKTSRATEKP
jgi:hypothetical protein